MELGTVLGVWAHPDDESFFSGGIMASSSRHGDRVVCVTATRGELGTRNNQESPAQLAEIREKELIAALGFLGVTEHQLLGYPDGGCQSVPLEEAVSRLQSIFEQVQPYSVLTFGPDGMTGHADHKAVSSWATEAFERSAPPGARLFYSTATPDWIERFLIRLNSLDLFEPGTPPVTLREELGILLEIPEDILRSKVSALEAHVSQLEMMRDAFGEDFIREAGSEEYFRLAAVR